MNTFVGREEKTMDKKKGIDLLNALDNITIYLNQLHAELEDAFEEIEGYYEKIKNIDVETITAQKYIDIIEYFPNVGESLEKYASYVTQACDEFVGVSDDFMYSLEDEEMEEGDE
jgi:hypothetical protein